MNINSNATSAIVDSFRLVRDGSALCGPVGARHRGAAGATGKQMALYAFGSLSRCFSVLCADRSVCVALMHLEQACCVWRCCGRASETKHETYSVT